MFAPKKNHRFVINYKMLFLLIPKMSQIYAN